MRQIISLLVLFICISVASAQAPKKKHAFYVTGAVNLGNYFGGDLNLNYVLKEKYTFKIGYTGNVRTAKSTPKDFHGRRSFLFYSQIQVLVTTLKIIGLMWGEFISSTKRELLESMLPLAWAMPRSQNL